MVADDATTGNEESAKDRKNRLSRERRKRNKQQAAIETAIMSCDGLDTSSVADKAIAVLDRIKDGENISDRTVNAILNKYQKIIDASEEAVKAKAESDEAAALQEAEEKARKKAEKEAEENAAAKKAKDEEDAKKKAAEEAKKVVEPVIAAPIVPEPVVEETPEPPPLPEPKKEKTLSPEVASALADLKKVDDIIRERRSPNVSKQRMEQLKQSFAVKLHTALSGIVKRGNTAAIDRAVTWFVQHRRSVVPQSALYKLETKLKGKAMQRAELIFSVFEELAIAKRQNRKPKFSVDVIAQRIDVRLANYVAARKAR